MEIRRLLKNDIINMNQRLREVGINRDSDYFSICFEEQELGKRTVLIAIQDDNIVGYVHLLKKSKYPFFKEQNIPEINDLNVFPDARRNGVGASLVEAIEQVAMDFDYSRVGLGVGLNKDYGSAQRIYCRRGYVLDGNGLQYKNQTVIPGTTIQVDDDLLLYLIKDLKE